MRTVVDVCDQIQKAAVVEDVNDYFILALKNIGFTSFAYLNLNSVEQSPLLISTYPNEWTTHYFDQTYASVDPVVRHSANSLLPLIWGREEEKRKLRGRCRTLFLEAEDFGIRMGITIPVHSPTGKWAAITLATEERDRQFISNISGQVPNLLYLTCHYNCAVERIKNDVNQNRRPCLTPREIECLRWVALGKGAWEIGEILSLATSTVTSYIESSKRKLGVYSRTHAVVKALMTGIIQL